MGFLDSNGNLRFKGHLRLKFMVLSPRYSHESKIPV